MNQLLVVLSFFLENLTLIFSILIVAFIALLVFTIIRLRMVAMYRDMLYNDPLTGVKKSNYLEDEFNNILVDFDRDVAMFYINIDNFKNYNDIFGFQTANKILSNFATRLKSLVKHNHVYRVHSDRFIILNAMEEANDASFDTALLRELKKPLIVEEEEIVLTVSIGRYDITEVAPRFHEAILACELALDKAKSYGKDQLVTYSGDLKNQHQNAFEMFQFLKNAIENESFFLEFQPIVETHSKKMVGFESLLRFNDKHRMFFPSEIIQHAEKFNMIEALDRLVIKQSFEAYRTFKKNKIPFSFLSINISSREVHNTTFLSFISEMLSAYEIAAEDIVIEFTETIDPEGMDTEFHFINQLRELGLKVAIDDFGSGYSSMIRLSKNALDRIKIDKSFVTDLTHSEGNRSLIEAMVNLGRAFNLDVIVEGVETQKEYDFIKTLDIMYVQGYYFYKPLTLDAIIKQFKPKKVSKQTK